MQVSKWWMTMIGHPCFLHQTVRLPLFVPSPLLQLALPDSGDLFFFWPSAISNQHSNSSFKTKAHPVDSWSMLTMLILDLQDSCLLCGESGNQALITEK